MGVSRATQDQRALDGAQHVSLLSVTMGGKRGARGKGGDRVGLVLPLGPGRGLGKVRAQSLADARPARKKYFNYRFALLSFSFSLSFLSEMTLTRSWLVVHSQAFTFAWR